MRAALLFLLVFAASAAEAAPAHKLACPATAPAAWGGGGKLSEVQILSQPRGEKIDETSTPSLVPDKTTVSGGTLRQYWTMNEAGLGWDYFVDCRYAGTKRFIRLQANGVKRCDRTITHYRRSGDPDPRAIDSLHCD